MDIIRLLHSLVRWAVLLVALVGLVYFVIGWLQSRPYDSLAKRLMRGFSMVISVQWLIGLILLIILGSQTGFGVRHYWEHLVTMTIAVAVSNVPTMLRRRELTDKQRYLVNVGVIIAVTVLVVVGIMALPEGIRWRLAA